MDGDLAQQAIQSAIKGEWKIAESLNRRTLEVKPKDVDALLRLANAQTQLGKIKDALRTYDKILKLEPQNLFAIRAVNRLKNLKKSSILGQHELSNSFLEEPGKTKTVVLVYPAESKTIAALDTGEPVLIVARPHRISVTTKYGVYIGRLPDDLAIRLIGFIKEGNKYDAAIKAVSATSVKIFLRETHRCQKFATTPSFPQDEFSNGHEI